MDTQRPDATAGRADPVRTCHASLRMHVSDPCHSQPTVDADVATLGLGRRTAKSGGRGGDRPVRESSRARARRGERDGRAAQRARGLGLLSLSATCRTVEMAGAHPDRGWRGLGTARTHRLRRAEDAGNRPAEGAAAKSRSASPWADFGEVGVATRTYPRLTVQSSIVNAARAAPLHRVAGAVIVSRRIPSSGTIPLFTA